MKLPLDMENYFVVISPNKTAFIEDNDEGLYERLDTKYENFQGHDLISLHEFTTDWPTWEIHPHGDEVVILISGSTTFFLKYDSGVATVELNQQGQYVVVPRNTWHTAKTPSNSRLIFITPGQGTKNIELTQFADETGSA